MLDFWKDSRGPSLKFGSCAYTNIFRLAVAFWGFIPPFRAVVWNVSCFCSWAWYPWQNISINNWSRDSSFGSIWLLGVSVGMYDPSMCCSTARWDPAHDARCPGPGHGRGPAAGCCREWPCAAAPVSGWCQCQGKAASGTTPALIHLYFSHPEESRKHWVLIPAVLCVTSFVPGWTDDADVVFESRKFSHGRVVLVSQEFGMLAGSVQEGLQGSYWWLACQCCFGQS